jgi:hypothetical protein
MQRQPLKRYIGPIAALAVIFAAPAIWAQSVKSLIAHQPSPGAVDLKAAAVYVDSGDFKLANIAAGLLCDDVQRVTGAKPALITDPAKLSGQAIIVGTIGYSPVLDQLIAQGRFDATGITGQWETYRLAVVANPLPNVPSALVIAGSDRRATAYGVFDLSEAIGVSPWYWWADATPVHQDALYVQTGSVKDGPPSVRYRGIFINDEDWGLEPWAAKTFEPQQHNIGPKTYAKAFELLLRLHANFLWPAMHPVSTEFGRIPENIKLADEWGIVMGASHTEAMNRNNVLWPKEGTGPWRYDTNHDNVLAYWEAWAKLRGPYEAVWTLGIRGVHDAAMLGPPDVPSRIKIVETAIADQRELIKKYVNPDVEKVPQAFTPYKEVLTLYQHGLKVPDDVTLLWPDDNFGYIRQLSTPAEQKRAGAAGIYYHISYLGHPRSYVWLNTTPPPLIWEEMSKAFDYGANRVWVCNVGDIKPGEIGMEFFLRLGWNIHAYDHTNVPQYLTDFAAREFGPDLAQPVADLLARYYHLGFIRKPEAMDTDSFNFKEAADRKAAYAALMDDATAIGKKLPADKQDEYFELVLYPVRAAGLTNDIFLDAQNGRPTGEDMKSLASETNYYNTTLAGGKWRYMMTEKGTDSTTWGFKWPAVAANSQLSVEISSAAPLVSIEAEHFTRNQARSGAQWETIAGLGRTADAVAVYPTTTPSITDPAQIVTQSPELDYDFTLPQGGPAQVTVYAIPTHRIHDGRGLRYAVAIDDEAPKIIGFEQNAGDTNREWGQNVIRNTAVTVTDHTLVAPGKHTLKVFMVDPGVLLEKLVVSFGAPPASDLGPPETR